MLEEENLPTACVNVPSTVHLKPDAPRTNDFRNSLPPLNVIMNILESQVTDLNYLAESPIAIPGFDRMNGQQSSESPADTGAQSGKKRKETSGEGDSTTNGNAKDREGAPHTRAKRNRYISIAW